MIRIGMMLKTLMMKESRKSPQAPRGRPSMKGWRLLEIPLFLVVLAVAGFPALGEESGFGPNTPSPGAATAPSGWAENRSYSTTCAEEDNVNVPLYCPGLRKYRVVAVHPTYCPCAYDGCPPDFSGCNGDVGNEENRGYEYEGVLRAERRWDQERREDCTIIWDDGLNVLEVCTVPDWWRPHAMDCTAGGQSYAGHFLRWYRKMAGEASWPQFFVLYEDGNARLKPNPPQGMSDVCFGSSVIIGPAPPAERPYVDIQRVEVDPGSLTLEITYRGGGTAAVGLSVDRRQAIAEVEIEYVADRVLPFATFRSMWVDGGTCDAGRIRSAEGDFPILGDWDLLAGPYWGFLRTDWSLHNTSAPDIWVKLDLLGGEEDGAGGGDGLELGRLGFSYGASRGET
jgi:hypothetical protein